MKITLPDYGFNREIRYNNIPTYTTFLKYQTNIKNYDNLEDLNKQIQPFSGIINIVAVIISSSVLIYQIFIQRRNKSKRLILN